MKATIKNSDYGLEIMLIPETVEENTILMRYGINAKMEKPNVVYSISKEPYLRLWLKKINPKVQKLQFLGSK